MIIIMTLFNLSRKHISIYTKLTNKVWNILRLDLISIFKVSNPTYSNCEDIIIDMMGIHNVLNENLLLIVKQNLAKNLYDREGYQFSIVERVVKNSTVELFRTIKTISLESPL